MALVFSSLFKTIIVFGKAFWEGIKSGSLKRVARRKFWPLVIVALKCLTLFRLFFGYLATSRPFLDH